MKIYGKVYNAIKTVLSGDFKTIALQQGQLSNMSEESPILTPCALIDLGETELISIQGNEQKGEMNIVIQTAVQAIPTEESKIFDMGQIVYSKLQDKILEDSNCPFTSRLTRTNIEFIIRV